jgi:hypothetical protein
MSVERLECPSCGASIGAEGPDPLSCAYCGSRLRITASSIARSVAPNAKARTSPMRPPMSEDDPALKERQATFDRLKHEVNGLYAERAQMIEGWKRGRRAQPRSHNAPLMIAAGVLICLGVWGLGGDWSGVALLSLLLGAGGMALACRDKIRRSRCRDATAMELREAVRVLEARIDRGQRELADLQDEIARMGGSS